MLTKCPDCGSPLIEDNSPLVFRTFDCGCVWKDLSTPVREMDQTMTCKDRTIASLTQEVERLKAENEQLRHPVGNEPLPAWITDFSGKPFHKEECLCEACLSWHANNKL